MVELQKLSDSMPVSRQARRLQKVYFNQPSENKILSLGSLQLRGFQNLGVRVVEVLQAHMHSFANTLLTPHPKRCGFLSTFFCAQSGYMVFNGSFNKASRRTYKPTHAALWWSWLLLYPFCVGVVNVERMTSMQFKLSITVYAISSTEHSDSIQENS